VTVPAKWLSYFDMIEILQPESRAATTVGFEIVVEGAASPYANSLARFIEVHQAIPESFLLAIADYESGRVVDAEQALNQPPPKPS
jgi:hypothetical protein